MYTSMSCKILKHGASHDRENYNCHLVGYSDHASMQCYREVAGIADSRYAPLADCMKVGGLTRRRIMSADICLDISDVIHDSFSVILLHVVIL